MFDSQKIADANFITSFDTQHHDLCDEIIDEFEKIIANEKGTVGFYMNGSESNNGTQNRKDESLLFQTCSMEYHEKIHKVLAEYTQNMQRCFQVLIWVITVLIQVKCKEQLLKVVFILGIQNMDQVSIAFIEL